MTSISSSDATGLGYGMQALQPTRPTGTTERLLAVLSRSRLRPSTIADETVCRVIRLSLLRAAQGPTAAVLKVARSVPGAAELRTQTRVLAELALHPGLDAELRELLPRILTFDERTDATVSVESYLPGIGLADVLARYPDRAEELTAAALSAIAPLHRRTATFGIVDDFGLLRQWVIEPLAGMTELCRRLDPRLVPEVSRLETILRRAFVRRRMRVSWTHGNYTPRNVRMAGVQGPVTGIVEWGGAGPSRLALIDEYLMILTASCQVERADLGTVVTERLRAGGLSDRERNALRAARDRSNTDSSDRDRIDECVDERHAILLTWLHHAVDLCRKRPTDRNHHIWATTVAPVLNYAAVFDFLGTCDS
jgi:Phosphotransferase enzyme family